jgi:hypothetical protein
MTIVPVLLFCSLLLVVGSLVLFVWSARQGDCHQAERLCLLPLEPDDAARAGTPDPPTPSNDNANTSDDHH